MEKKTIFIKGDRIVELGAFGVDSGQVLIADPCYINSQWSDEEFEDVRPYMNVKTKEVLSYPKDFTSFEQVIKKYGKTMNQLIEENVFVKKEIDEDEMDNSFSYNGCCQQTLKTEEQGGELRYKMGHTGAGVVSSTRHGDGSYVVYAVKDEENNTKQLIIDFGYEEDSDNLYNQLQSKKAPLTELKSLLHKIISHLEKSDDKTSKKLKGELLEKMMEIL
jgi:hypothetical protein